MQRLPFPRYLDTPHHIIMWTVDEVMVFVACTILGIIDGHMLPGMAVGAAMMYVYRRYRDRHPNGYLRHLAYWYGLVPIKGRGRLNPFQRRVLP